MQEAIAATIRTAVREQRIVGALVLVAINGELVRETAEGFFDREAKVPMRQDALFRLASVTKLFVAVATMMLISQGRLRLDDRVDAYLPYFKPSLSDGSTPIITIRHLLTHTAGLGYGFYEKEDGPLHRAGVSDGMDISALTLEENLRRLSSAPLNFAPGTSWLYSLSFDVLGGVLESIEHKPLAEVIHCLIIRPLRLKDTGFHVADRARLAPPYVNAVGAPALMAPLQRVPSLEGLAPVLLSPDRAFQKSAFPSGGAGMIGSPQDVLTLLEILRFGGGSLLPHSFVADMGKNHTRDLTIVGRPGWSYGLGFSVLSDPKPSGTPESIGTWRWGGAYGHSWFVDPARKLTCVAFTNTTPEGMFGGGRFPLELRDALYEAL